MVSEPLTPAAVFPYERQAKDGEEMPDNLAYPEQICFLCFRMLYAQLRMGIIDRDTAVLEKRKILREYQCYQFSHQMGAEWVEVIKQTELARAAYRKNPSLETANKLVALIEGRKNEPE